MSTVTCFSFPFDRGVGSPFQKISKKRKRADTELDSNSADNLQLQLPLDEREAFDNNPRSRRLAAASDFEENLPESSFPHNSFRSTTDTVRVLSQVELDAGLFRLKPPIYRVRDPTSIDNSTEQGDRSSIRRRHLQSLTSILHNSLLQGDYLRAGRAWGMLLRTEVDGHRFDPRIQGRWGIGAEILLRRDAQMANLGNDGLIDGSSPRSDRIGTIRTGPIVSIFCDEGFSKAKNYYESLILQYPLRKQSPKTVNSLSFYPAMFGLWIYSVQEQQKATLAAVPEVRSDQSNDDERKQHSRSEELHHSTQQKTEREEVARRTTLRQAEEISSRLDVLLLSPPYIDDAKMWDLRGMVALWASDLCIPSSPPHLRQNDDVSSVTEDGMSGDESDDRMEAALQRNAYDQSVIAKQAYAEMAKKAFEAVIRLKMKVREER